MCLVNIVGLSQFKWLKSKTTQLRTISEIPIRYYFFHTKKKNRKFNFIAYNVADLQHSRDCLNTAVLILLLLFDFFSQLSWYILKKVTEIGGQRGISYVSTATNKQFNKIASKKTRTRFAAEWNIINWHKIYCFDCRIFYSASHQIDDFFPLLFLVSGIFCTIPNTNKMLLLLRQVFIASSVKCIGIIFIWYRRAM